MLLRRVTICGVDFRLVGSLSLNFFENENGNAMTLSRKCFQNMVETFYGLTLIMLIMISNGFNSMAQPAISPMIR